MANRNCPMCFHKVPRAAVLARSAAVDCPRCGRGLELSRPSRLLASLLGLLGAWFAFHYTSGGQGPLSWAVPLLASILAFGVVAPVFLMLNADLVVRPEAGAELLAAAPGHGAQH
jgi:hypothetical protein